MPVEIRELIVRAIISSSCTGNTDKNNECPDEKEIIIAECVEKTLQIIKEKEER
jgi:hypothetical protein